MNMLVSIITVNYNNKEGLEKTAKSISSQKFKDFEWIVIDGGSNDGSVDVIKKYHDKMSYWVSEPDKGIFNAMNKGVEKANGDYLIFINSGDCFYDDKTLKVFSERNNTEDIVYGDTVKVNKEDEIVAHWYTPQEITKFSFFWNHFINHQSAFFSKRCFTTFRYDENLRLASDVELFMSLMYHGYSFGKIDLIVARYDISGASSTTDTSKEIKSAISASVPKPILNDYDDIIKIRDVDLGQMILKIINSNKFFRYITRVFIYPIFWLTKLIGKNNG